MRSIHNVTTVDSKNGAAVNHYVKIQFEINSQHIGEIVDRSLAVNHYVKIQFEINSQQRPGTLKHLMRCKPLRKNTI